MSEPKPYFIVHKAPASSVSPLVFDSPHSGDIIPPGIHTDATEWERSHLRDSHIEKILRDSPEHGVAVLENHLDRVVIDMNSEEYEIDPSGLSGHWSWPSRLTRNVTGRRLGLIATAMQQPDDSLRPLFNATNRLAVATVINRIHLYHRPYHQELKRLISEAVRSHGFAIHINFHSSPRKRIHGHDVVIGDLKGTSAHPDLVKHVAGFFAGYYSGIALNKPYPGGALVRGNGNREHGVHSIQIEFARDLLEQPDFQFEVIKGGILQKVISSFAQDLKIYAQKNAHSLKGFSYQPERPATLGMGSA